MPENYDDWMDKTLDACEESFTTDITQVTPIYVALQDAVKNYVEEENAKK